MTTQLKIGQVRAILGISDTAINDWVSRYYHYFSDVVKDRRPGEHRMFTEDDLLVLSTIAFMRGRGETWNMVDSVMSAGTRYHYQQGSSHHNAQVETIKNIITEIGKLETILETKARELRFPSNQSHLDAIQANLDLYKARLSKALSELS